MHFGRSTGSFAPRTHKCMDMEIRPRTEFAELWTHSVIHNSSLSLTRSRSLEKLEIKWFSDEYGFSGSRIARWNLNFGFDAAGTNGNRNRDFLFFFRSVLGARPFFLFPIIFDVAIKRFSARFAFGSIRRVHTAYLVFCVYVVFTLNAGFQDDGGSAAAAVVSLSASYYLLTFFVFSPSLSLVVNPILIHIRCVRP